ncbi:GIY-YIG nuclease family protein [Halopenitus persicus]|uniref:Endonuclease-3 n=1 Tax=Halopenitus persicus TaxID=1048396 RepID=A0A1H3DYM0_9EURY|nr:GIY-YIG nuclease family protein [Halopenitus persicus]SDX71487.1 endonuclease-3 [Halopenitus persicus]
MAGGTYTLVLSVPEPIAITVGALGSHRLPSGGYAYTGSALGRGGFARVDRHRELAAGERDTRHWHIDYLLGHPTVGIDDVVRTDERDVECAVAKRLGEGPVPGFGASDCGCASHLARRGDVEAMRAAVESAHAAV